MAENKANIPLDDFVSKVVKDPKQPPDTTLLTGYLGKSSEEGHTRIYFDPELKNYLEVPNDAVLHTQEIPKEVSSLGGSHIWIKSDAELIHGKVGPSRTKAKFFEGPIAAAAAGFAGGAAGVQQIPPGQAFTAAFVCPTPHVGGCTQPPTPGIICGISHPCETSPVSVVYCPPTPFCPPHTVPALCFPHFTPGCPLATAQACPSIGGCPSIACGFHGGGVVDPGVQQFAAHGVTIPCPPTPGIACPSHLVVCPHTPLHGCPIPTQITHCPTPFHGCPPPLTQVCTIAVQCHTHLPVQCPTFGIVCPQTVHAPCVPHLTANCPVISAQTCPTAGACPSIACGGFPGGGGDPVAQQHATIPQCHPVTIPGCHFPTVPAHFCPPPTLGCPTLQAPCATHIPAVCHFPTHFCPVVTAPLVCHPLTPVCPTIHACQSVPICPSAGACPSIACGGNPGGGGINQ